MGVSPMSITDVSPVEGRAILALRLMGKMPMPPCPHRRRRAVPACRLASFCTIDPIPETLLLCPPGHITNGDGTWSNWRIGFVFTDTRSTPFFHNLFPDRQLASVDSSSKLASFRTKGLPSARPISPVGRGRAPAHPSRSWKLASFCTIDPAPETLSVCPHGHTTNGDRTWSNRRIGFVFTGTRFTPFFHNHFHDRQLTSIGSSWKLASFCTKDRRSAVRSRRSAAAAQSRTAPGLGNWVRFARFVPMRGGKAMRAFRPAGQIGFVSHELSPVRHPVPVIAPSAATR
jgi:hypothetical protein